ncbi:hypothetical protein [Aquipuribacter hungaricus]|uniref:JAB domain-containing protein n=1 Tax=Aquipuribacter hungaricus TaxID=545624 RepID=A0ABV7WH51_9MICO
MSTTVRVPDAVWQDLLGLFEQHQPGVERIAYLDGFRVDENGYPGSAGDAEVYIATTVVVPDALLRRGNYVVPAEAISRAGQHLRTRRMTRVAQVHSHGDDWVEHSGTDDERAYSQRPGSLSIVVPFHGTERPDISDCGVHLRTTSGWQRVPAESVITTIPSALDHRSTTWTPRPNPTPSGGTSSPFRAWTRSVLRRLGPST